jgi:hypothetical protein
MEASGTDPQRAQTMAMVLVPTLAEECSLPSKTENLDDASATETSHPK